MCPFHVALPFSSGQTKGAFGEQFDAKNKLTCSICLKEFKSLPALNGHMRSHGGMRASPSLKQVSKSLPRPLQVVCCLLCFAAVSVRWEMCDLWAPGEVWSSLRVSQMTQPPLPWLYRQVSKEKFLKRTPPLSLEKGAEGTV